MHLFFSCLAALVRTPDPLLNTSDKGRHCCLISSRNEIVFTLSALNMRLVEVFHRCLSSDLGSSLLFVVCGKIFFSFLNYKWVLALLKCFFSFAEMSLWSLSFNTYGYCIALLFLNINLTLYSWGKFHLVRMYTFKCCLIFDCCILLNFCSIFMRNTVISFSFITISLSGFSIGPTLAHRMS